MSEWNPKTHVDRDNVLLWGDDMTDEQLTAMKNGEVFILLSEDEKPFSRVLMDSYDQIREQKLFTEELME